MTTLAPSATRKKPRFDNGPFLKSLIGVVGTLMTIAIAVALFKFLTGLAADDGAAHRFSEVRIVDPVGGVGAQV